MAPRFIEVGKIMASDTNPVMIPATSLVHGSQAPTAFPPLDRKSLPPAGNTAAGGAARAQSSAVTRTNDVQAQVAFLNKYLNDSGRPDQFRVAPNSDSMLIQQIDPATERSLANIPPSFRGWRRASASPAL